MNTLSLYAFALDTHNIADFVMYNLSITEPIPEYKFVSAITYYCYSIIFSKLFFIELDPDQLLVEMFNILSLDYDGLGPAKDCVRKLEGIPYFIYKIYIHSQQNGLVPHTFIDNFRFLGEVNYRDFSLHWTTHLNNCISSDSYSLEVTNRIFLEILPKLKETFPNYTFNIENFNTFNQRLVENHNFPSNYSKLICLAFFSFISLYLVSSSNDMLSFTSN